METLEGGRQGDILRDGNRVYRPAGAWTHTVHALLRYVRQQGFIQVPEPLGIDELGREVVSYLPGDVSDSTLRDNHRSTATLISAAKLLQHYHQATENFQVSVEQPANWQLAPRTPAEVICHGDYAPYNVVYSNDLAVGMIDFDTAHPGPRVWDVAYALYRWVPFSCPSNAGVDGTIDQQMERARVFCNAYDVNDSDRLDLVPVMIDRLQTMINYIVEQAAAGDNKFQDDIEAGHVRVYERDMEYIDQHRKAIHSALLPSTTT